MKNKQLYTKDEFYKRLEDGGFSIKRWHLDETCFEIIKEYKNSNPSIFSLFYSKVECVARFSICLKSNKGKFNHNEFIIEWFNVWELKYAKIFETMFPELGIRFIINYT